MSPLRRLSPEQLASLASALDAERLRPPYTEVGVRAVVGSQLSSEIATELSRLSERGFGVPQLRELFQFASQESAPSATLVWSGPDEGSAATRDTSIVLRELFQKATRNVLVAGFAVYQGKSVFAELARRMEQIPSLRVLMFLNIERRRGDTTRPEDLVAGFSERFRREQWPGSRLPCVYYDQRALELNAKQQKRAALHAKCVVVDDEDVFITSANFTEAAQDRNIEVGVLLRDASLARQLLGQFEGLVVREKTTRVASLGTP